MMTGMVAHAYMLDICLPGRDLETWRTSLADMGGNFLTIHYFYAVIGKLLKFE